VANEQGRDEEARCKRGLKKKSGIDELHFGFWV
jgi:hypothetical protein